MANVLAILFVGLCVGIAIWGIVREKTLSCNSCSGDCGSCGASCSTGKELKLSKKQLAQIEKAKAAAKFKEEVHS